MTQKIKLMKTRPNGHIWMVAEQFYNAAELIWNCDDIDINRYSHPLIVNYAFSCELSLKATEGSVKFPEPTPDGLIPVSNIESSVRGHNLYNVFQKLKHETQEEIKNEFSSCSGEELVPLLIECSGYFEKARYPFEQKAGSYFTYWCSRSCKRLI